MNETGNLALTYMSVYTKMFVQATCTMYVHQFSYPFAMDFYRHFQTQERKAIYQLLWKESECAFR